MDTTYLNPDLPSQDERVMAALSHITVLIPTIGVIAPIVIWATQKDKSRFVAFQALQAAAFQLSIIVMWFIGMGCYMGSFFLMFGGAALSQSTRSIGPAEILVIVPFIIFFGMLLLILVMVIIGIIAAVMAFQGKDFRYPILGSWVARYTQPTTTPRPSEPAV